MSLKAEMAQAALEILAQVGEPVTWTRAGAGQTPVVLTGIVSQATESVGGLGSGGFKADYEFTVKVLAPASGPAPKPLDSIAFDGQTYAIKGVSRTRVGPYTILQIGTP
jgi:hypothetical protein